jgi:molecular chaperone DnaK (HSP70)
MPFQIVGLAAKSGLGRNGPSTVVHNKKLLNEKIEEIEIEEVVNANTCKVKHEEGSMRYEIKKDDKVFSFTPEEVATCIFKKMYGEQHLLNNF